jgi:hypothetical protein
MWVTYLVLFRFGYPVSVESDLLDVDLPHSRWLLILIVILLHTIVVSRAVLLF